MAEVARPVRPVRPVDAPLDATIRPPGSKSITNRALVCAALARGASELHGVLIADDTEAMIDCLRALGVSIVPRPPDRSVVQNQEDPSGSAQQNGERNTVRVVGCGGRPPAEGAILDARLSGTTSRFLAPVATLARGTVVLDGAEPLRRRPMAAVLDALERLGADVDPLGEPGHLPVRITAARRQRLGGRVEVSGDVSSQFLSGLLLAAPCFDDGLDVTVSTALVSVPYVRLTIEVMRSFGAVVDHADDWSAVRVASGGYDAVGRYEVEPDASAASYWAAAAVIAGGTVRIDGLGHGSCQGDVGFIDLLARMGAEVTWSDRDVVISSTDSLHGIDVDMSDISDTAQTLAVVAPFADSPTTVRGIGFIRGKETNRISAVVTELRRLGIDAEEHDDGFSVRPGPVSPGDVRTYDDHRMAMSFALLGLRTPGIRIVDPDCVAKTYPGFWQDLARVSAPGSP